tara:strand:- start:194 stop:466 length:273 start_codon:yes stop_codon:yes gene_type:complete
VGNNLKDYKEKIISHMNEEHSNSIVSALHAQHGIKDKNAKMVILEENGYFALSNKKSYFLKFENVCKSVSDFKTELIKHAKKYRSFELNN